ncbi:mannose-1-phosphate guanylyltransferase [Rossellomorea vietnamensis]|uniref:Mannose-1-phosphate guanylyltransferase n=1 Tax=Rossellomorea vietnamensis TaxID=218284 RepID=A0A5D4NVN9_9BACI|nr:sugar phosphate nucleotidyltransferase [Rossellomorea vietnamensis]TYS17741.1 mannose-1-phosphate guanylyltransferase [Rossellomorea vietnamensis]
MKLILLSGGSGKRLWPLSNDARSKQFLKVLDNGQGAFESMVQRVWAQLNNVGLEKETVIATSKSQVDMIKNQLNNQSDLIVEPSRRDTFPAIALAAAYFYTVKKASIEEVVSVLPVDPYVHDNFFEKVKEMESVIYNSDSDIALLGVQPTCPSTKYGYIVPEKERNNSLDFLPVNRFTEKPSEEVARELINDNALWNCGVFAFKLGYIIDILKEKGLPFDYEELLTHYDQLPKISFDYEVVEKASNIVVLPYNGYWKDLGTWNSLTEEMSTNHMGKGILGNECKDTHLINELDIPVTVLGVSNLVVVASPDGILISEKQASTQIKEIVNNINNRPMYEERRWGWYKVLDHTKNDNSYEVLTKRIGILKGKNLSYQTHNLRNELWTIIKGEGILALNGVLRGVKQGDVVQIKQGDYHAIKAISDIEIIEVQSGSELIEEDIVRLYTEWQDIENECFSFSK